MVCVDTAFKRKIWKLLNLRYLRQNFTTILFFFGQLEDGHTLFDYNVGLNDIVQLLIRSESEAPTTVSMTDEDGEVNPVLFPTARTKSKKQVVGLPVSHLHHLAHFSLILALDCTRYVQALKAGSLPYTCRFSFTLKRFFAFCCKCLCTNCFFSSLNLISQ